MSVNPHAWRGGEDAVRLLAGIVSTAQLGHPAPAIIGVGLGVGLVRSASTDDADS